MNILDVTYILNSLIMIGVPIGLAIFLVRKFKLAWRLWWIGGVIFVICYLLQGLLSGYVVPLLYRTSLADLPAWGQIIFNAVFWGIAMGLIGEFVRYGVYRWWVKDVWTWEGGLLAGMGNGGMGIILGGVFGLMSLINMIYLRNIDLSTVVTPENLELAQEQVASFWAQPWHLTLLPALDSLFVIPAYLALSVIVLQAFLKSQFRWVWIAAACHALWIGVITFISQLGWSQLAIEGVVGLFAALSVVVIFKLYKPAEAASTTAS